MKLCKFCGQQLDDNANFCPHCMKKQISVQKVEVREQSGRKKIWLSVCVSVCMVLVIVGSVGGFFLAQRWKKEDDAPAVTVAQKADSAIIKADTPVKQETDPAPETNAEPESASDASIFIKKWT